MNKQIEIEEMANIVHDADAKIIYDMVKAKPDDFVGRALPRQVYIAKALYAEGYRKAADVAEEIFEEIEENCVDPFGYFDAIAFYKLRKKYESEGAEDEN